MNNFDNHYNAYLDNVFKLAGTVSVKSSLTAIKMNEYLITKTMNEKIIDENDSTQWPYFLNLRGEYHPAQTMMYVTSMDTLQTIAFTKANLELHVNTKREYSYGTHKYEELVERFPDQELLIRGILYPADELDVLTLPEGSILSYDKRFVEDNEYSLMFKLNDWSVAYFQRWNQPQYNINHDLFNIAFMGVYYTKLVEAIIVQRKELCLTNEAHSYHIRRFLASHDFMDFYMDMMSKEQSLKFYKNIRWIVRNLGHRYTFDYLVNLVMTKRHLPIADYTLVLDETLLKLGEVKSIPRFDKHSINGLESINKELDSNTIEEMLEKELPLATDNPNAYEDGVKQAHDEYTASLDNDFRTKILESKVIDYSDSEPVTLDMVIADMWVDLVDRGLFTAVVLVENPVNGETLPLTGMDALKLFNYALSKSQGLEPTCIPCFNVTMGQPKKRVTEADLRKMMPDSTYLPDSWYKFVLKGYRPLKQVISLDSFYNQALEQFNVLNDRLKLVGFEDDADARAFKEATVWRMYSRRMISTANPGETYQTFLGVLGLDNAEMKDTEWGRLALEIWKHISGANLYTVQSLRNVHKAMLQIMTKLTSYSVHYIGDINASSITTCKIMSTRVAGAPRTKGHFTLPIPVPDIRVWGTRGRGHTSIDLMKTGKNFIFESNDGKGYSSISGQYSGVQNQGGRFNVKGGKPMGTGVDGYMMGDERDPNEPNLFPKMVPGTAGFLKLPLAIQRQIAKDTFGVNLDWMDNRPNNNEPSEPLDWNVRNEHLHGFNYSGDLIPPMVKAFSNILPPKDKYL